MLYRELLYAWLGPDDGEKWAVQAEEWDAKHKAEGEAQGWAESVLTVLTTRGISVANELRERILACRDDTLLNQWLARAITASSADEVFAG